MIQLKQLDLFQGSQPLLEQTSVQLHDGWKIAMIGRNGCGKSSFFRLLLNQMHADAGEYQIPSSWRIAHMAQEVSALERSALDYVLDGHKPFRQISQAMSEAEKQGNDKKLASLLDDMEQIQGFELKHKAEQLLSGLGFKTREFDQPVQSFSGGWRIRLNLAQALIAPSDLLLLDEPTNHLDLEACLWLEQWLKNYPGTLILVSHDRDFIDQVADHILSFEHRKLVLYTGNYEQYERTRAQRLEQHQAAYQKQQQRIQDIQRFVDRFRAKATKARQAQSRLKELDRMVQLAPAHIDSEFSFRFDCNEKVSDPLVSFHQLALGYDQPLIKNLELRLGPGDRIGLLGSNGAGKSTLIKAIAGELKPLSGHIHQGQNLAIGYFAQHQLESLDLQASPLLHMQRLDPDAGEQDLRNFLGGFGFKGDQADDPVTRFSGGEKARLSLAMIAWQKPNLLLLDEPTNHLDLETRQALTLALQEFEGAVLVVSHDRHLLRNTVDQFWLVANQSVSVFEGDLQDYANLSNADLETENTGAADNQKQTAVDKKALKRQQAEIRQQLSPLKKQLKSLEDHLDHCHQTQRQLEQQLADTSLYDDANKSKLQELLQQQARVSSDLAETEEHWLQVQEQLEELSAQLTDGSSQA